MTVPFERRKIRYGSSWAAWLLGLLLGAGSVADLELVGVQTVPHVRAENLLYRKAPSPDLAALVRVFLRNRSAEPFAIQEVRVRGKSPADLVKSGEWGWQDIDYQLAGAKGQIPPGATVAWTWNGAAPSWGTGAFADLQLKDASGKQSTISVPIGDSKIRIASVTFLAPVGKLAPNRVVIHIANDRDDGVRLDAVRIYLPSNPREPFSFQPASVVRTATPFPIGSAISGNDHGGYVVETEPLPLTYCIVEVQLESVAGQQFSLWSTLRIKREVFDISAGWCSKPDTPVGPSLQYEPFLKTLRRMHINTGHIGEIAGYTDKPLYDRYPLKYFNRLQPIEKFDTDAVLPRIHGVEFLGEPQYDAKAATPPQKVFDELSAYRTSRLPTTVTLSDERNWRLYVGTSDFPHYDAYRVVAPTVDAWSRYNRWDGKRIFWGAPLETIGDYCVSLREMSRPNPCAYWSQGPHDGWMGVDGRQRRSPTADELRLQAYHALATRITSLYWFNLSPKALVKYRDTLDELCRVGREIKMLESLYLEGDGVWGQRVTKADGAPDWDLRVVAGPRATLLFALDLDYGPDPKEAVFAFGPPRPAKFTFPVPSFALPAEKLVRVDADGSHEIPFKASRNMVTFEDKVSRVGIYVLALSSNTTDAIEAHRKRLIDFEKSFHFDPAQNDEDFALLQKMVP